LEVSVVKVYEKEACFSFQPSYYRRLHINWRYTSIGAGIYVEYLPSAPIDLFYATYVEPVVEKEARSIQNDPRYQPR
jgi:hypothetical protein